MTSSLHLTFSNDQFAMNYQLPITNVFANRHSLIANALSFANGNLLIAERREV